MGIIKLAGNTDYRHCSLFPVPCSLFSTNQKKSSAQITKLYTQEELIEQQVLAVVNFPPRQVADFISEVLVLYHFDKLVLHDVG